MRTFFLILFLTFATKYTYSQTNVYLLPGEGSDYRIFEKIRLDTNYKIIYIKLPTPNKGATMREYSTQIANQIDTSKKFILIGVSFGGMLCVEMADYLRPEKVIIISSAKSIKELPFTYRFQKAIPINKLTPAYIIKAGAKILQPIYEPDRNNNKETFKTMLNSHDKIYFKRTVNMIIGWKRKNYSSKIIHIHGENDHTIPIRNVKENYKIKNGSHMMTLTRGDEINCLLLKILNDK